MSTHRLFGSLALLALVGCPTPDTGKDSSGVEDTGDSGDTAADTCTDGSEPATWYTDADRDGYGNPDASTVSCLQPPDAVDNADDCNDTDDAVHPGAEEACNGADDNCDGQTDEGIASTWYADTDLDGVGDEAASVFACSAPEHHVAIAGDCDDRNENVYPGAVELCSGVDEDCDGTLDDSMTGVYEAADGTITDISALLVAGTADAPTYIGDQDGYQVLARDGTVTLCEGVYYAKIVMADLGSDLTVRGAAGADATVLTTGGTAGGDDGSIVAVTGATLRVEGLTITGGLGSEGNTKGGGVAITQSGAVTATPNVTFTDSIITGNLTDYGGGIALFDYASVALVDTVVLDNEARQVGGGVWVQDNGVLTCEASGLALGGILDNTAPIAGGFYFSSKTNGVLTSTGCDWGAAGVDDNTVYDIQRQPHTVNAWCFGNAGSVTDTVACDGTGCTGTAPVVCE